MDNLKFGAFLASLRKEKGWTQRTLADKINVTDKAVSKWERGLGFPDIKTIEPLADALGISVLELIRAERIEENKVATSVADDALERVLDIASYQEALRRGKIISAVIAATALVALVFLIDNLELFGVVMVYLPVTAFVVGVLLLAVAFRNYIKGISWKATLIAGVITISWPIIIWVILFCAGVSGMGPVPN